MTNTRLTIGLSRVPIPIAFALLSCAIGVDVVAQPDQRRIASADRTGGAIAGVVVASDSSQPMRQANVTLRASEGDFLETAVTDDLGRFSFMDLPAGYFILSASKPGFLDTVFGQRQAGSGAPGVPIALSSRQRVEKVVPMSRGAALEGIIFDDWGEPAVGIEVSAMRRVFSNYDATLRKGGSAISDDRGRYRISALPSGQYLVMAIPRDKEMEQLALERAVKAVHDLVLERRGAADDAERPLKKASLGGSTFEKVVSREFAPVFFPGTPIGSTAVAINLAPAQEVSAVNFGLQKLALAQVSGTLGGTTNGLLENCRLFLRSSDEYGIGMQVVRPDTNGYFSFTGVAPGRYSVIARSEIRRNTKPGSPSVSRFSGLAELVVVIGDNIVDASLALHPAVSVRGIVNVDGQAIASGDLMNVTLFPIDTIVGDLPVSASVDSSGHFVVPNVASGRYLIGVSGTADGLVAKSVIFNGIDLVDTPLDVAGDGDIIGGVVTLTSRLTQIVGVIIDQTGLTVSDHTIIVFPSDASLWRSQSRRIRALKPTADGRYTVIGLPPGDYLLTAVADTEPTQRFDGEVLRELVSQAKSVKLVDGERTVQNLKITR